MIHNIKLEVFISIFFLFDFFLNTNQLHLKFQSFLIQSKHIPVKSDYAILIIINIIRLLLFFLVIMIIQPQAIQLAKSQKLTRLILTNTSANPFIFKIKTNNLQVINATPANGTIPSQSRKDINIKILTQKQFDAKILVTYGRPQGNQVGSKNKSMNKFVVPIKKKAPLQTIMEQQFHSSKISQSDFSVKTSRNKQIFNEYKRDSGNQFWQKKYKQETTIAARLKQKLEISEEKLIKIEKENAECAIKSANHENTEKYQLKFNQILFCCLLLFIMGYTVGKF